MIVNQLGIFAFDIEVGIFRTFPKTQKPHFSVFG